MSNSKLADIFLVKTFLIIARENNWRRNFRKSQVGATLDTWTLGILLTNIV
jgi:hypothetical protein